MSSNANQGQPNNKDFYNGAWHLTIDNQVIEVTEEVYRAYKQPLWAERKRQEREKRCIVSNGKGGTKRCTRNCRECDMERAKKGLPPIDRTGSVLSMDKFSADGFDIPESISVDELVADKLLLEELYKALEELDPENRLIAELFSMGKTEREIAESIGRSQKTINNRKPKIFTQLLESLKNWSD
jgi:DNA-directed RNA polymerase specialized sigma24 family protein